VLDKLCKALTEKFKGDKAHPGVFISWLPENEEWYVCIHRFPAGIHSRKYVTWGKGADLTKVLKEVASKVFKKTAEAELMEALCQ
jgi:hypothetical protein